VRAKVFTGRVNPLLSVIKGIDRSFERVSINAFIYSSDISRTYAARHFGGFFGESLWHLLLFQRVLSEVYFCRFLPVAAHIRQHGLYRLNANIKVARSHTLVGQFEFQKAWLTLRERYPAKEIHEEILGKIQRDDAAEELGLTEKQVYKLRRIRAKQLVRTAVDPQTLLERYANISSANR
jgi:hypothetical protein